MVDNKISIISLLGHIMPIVNPFATCFLSCLHKLIAHKLHCCSRFSSNWVKNRGFFFYVIYLPQRGLNSVQYWQGETTRRKPQGWKRVTEGSNGLNCDDWRLKAKPGSVKAKLDEIVRSRIWVSSNPLFRCQLRSSS